MFVKVVESVGQGIDAAGVAVVVIGATAAVIAAAVHAIQHQSRVYQRLRQQLGQSILLGLELLVAADIIRTVAVTPTLLSVLVLAGIVLIRTFLSFSLELEISGRWPWQKPLSSTTDEKTSESPAFLRDGPTPADHVVFAQLDDAVGEPMLVSGPS